METVERFDPAGYFRGVRTRDQSTFNGTPHGDELQRLRLLIRSLHGKRILSMSGGADQLVPYRCSQPFIRWLQQLCSQVVGMTARQHLRISFLMVSVTR